MSYNKDQFLEAVENGDIDSVRTIITRFPDKINDQIHWNGSTALIKASSRGYLEIVRLLLQQPGIDVNAKANDGWTAAIQASYGGHLEIVRLLLQQPGIDVNAKDHNGSTALMVASYVGHLEIVRLLLEQPSIDLNAKNNNGSAALIQASYGGHLEIVQLLLEQPNIDVNATNNYGRSAVDVCCNVEGISSEKKANKAAIISLLEGGIIRRSLPAPAAAPPSAPIPTAARLASGAPSITSGLVTPSAASDGQLEEQRLQYEALLALNATATARITALENQLATMTSGNQQRSHLRESFHSLLPVPPASTAARALPSTIPDTSLIAISQMPLPAGRDYHVFLAHDWGTEQDGYLNHRKVSKINAALRRRGIVTWFDDERMSTNNGDIRGQMTRGIEKSEFVLIFVTKRYQGKVNSEDMGDNCYYEFQFASLDRPNRRQVVVTDPDMTNPRVWNGRLRAELGSLLFSDFSKYDFEATSVEFELACDSLAHSIAGGSPRV